jgi:ankyrin repeat protein
MSNFHMVSPLHLAAWDGDVAEVNSLLRLHANIEGYIDDLNEGGFTALTCAALGGHIGMVRVLLEAGCDKDKVSHDGKTALATAAECDQVEIVQELIAYACDTRIFSTIKWGKLMGCTQLVFQTHWCQGCSLLKKLDDDCNQLIFAHLRILHDKGTWQRATTVPEM